MTLNLGSDLFYIGASPEDSTITRIQELVAEHSISIDQNDSITCYRIVEDALTPVAAGISLADPGEKPPVASLNLRAPGTEPGLFQLPPGKYGFLQLQADPDHVIMSERSALLEYMEEKGTPGNRDYFFIRTISEDDKEVYQILIPVEGEESQQ